MKHLNFRCSEGPRVCACPASAHGEGVLINEDNDIARVGTCGHDLLAAMIAAGAHTTPSIDRYLQIHNVEDYADDIDFLMMQGCRLWHGYKDIIPLSKYFPHPQPEIRRSKTLEVKGRPGYTITLSGHLDISTFVMSEYLARVLDWKMGYKSESGRYIDQMKGYAFLQVCESPQIKTVTATIAWLRDGIAETFSFTRKELFAWAKAFFTEHIWWDGQTYNPGWACQYCPRRCSCPGITAHTQELAIAFGPGGDVRGQIAAMGAGRILPADVFNYSVEMAKFLRGKCEKFLGLAKKVAAEQGPFPIPGEPGKAWGIRTKKGKSTISVAVGWPVISEVIPQDELGAIVSVGKGKLEKAFGAQVAKGKGKFIKDKMQELEDCGAITRGADTLLLEKIDVEEK